MIKLEPKKNAMDKNLVKEISFSKAMAILVGAVIATAVSTAFTVVRVINSDHFTIISIDSRVSALETEVVPRSEFVIQIESLGKNMDKHFESQNRRLERIENNIDAHFLNGGGD